MKLCFVATVTHSYVLVNLQVINEAPGTGHRCTKKETMPALPEGFEESQRLMRSIAHIQVGQKRSLREGEINEQKRVC